MTSKNRWLDASGLTIDYKTLGIISIEELAHAIWEDVQTLRKTYNVRYVKSPRLRLYVTDEYGEEIKVRRPGGGHLQYLRTHHHRPACKDYEL